ncbi:MAG: LacI family DNA-binding transcriptional regulator [Christensenellaceae bacterium]
MYRGRKQLGIKEIARMAGVSTATVSRVLNTPEVTSPAAQKKVLDVIRQHDFMQQQGVMPLKSDHSNTIGFFVYDISNPFFVDLMTHLNTVAFRHKYTLLLCYTENDRKIQKEYFEYCKQIRAAGIAYARYSAEDSFFEDFGGVEGYSPAVALIDSDGYKDKACYRVYSDHKKGTEMLVEYLYKLNHRKIGFITGPERLLPVRLRKEAFLENMQKLGLEVPEQYIYNAEFSFRSGSEAFDYFYSLPDAPTAIIAANDQNARGFIMRAHALGVKIPDEFSVCSFDGILPETFFPMITSIRQNMEQLAESIFFSIINAEKEPPPKDVVVDVSMITGLTCHKI